MVLIVGMARSGISAARLLKKRGFDVFLTDSGQPSTLPDDIPYEVGTHTTSRFLEAGEIVVSPGVPLDIEPLRAARAKGVPIVSELELASRYLRGDIVAITGSNGKTTTTTLLGEILRATGRPVQIGGNIGFAMTGLVETSTAETINVVEVSSFQLDGIHAFRPDVGVLLNITPDHLDRYPTFHEYRLSKFRLFANQSASQAAILNRDDAEVYPPPRPIHSSERLFSQQRPVDCGAHRAGSDLYLDGVFVMKVQEIPVPGSHNVENVLASIAAAGVYRVTPEKIAQTVREFRGVEHRIEYAGTINAIDFYNDSKATNVDSSIKAVESFAGNIMIILGGKDKGASYEPLVQAMNGRVKHVFLIGAAAPKIAAALGDRFPQTRVHSMHEAVEAALALGSRGDILLLSPACASFDMFDNYEHRGRVFKEAVERISDFGCRNLDVCEGATKVLDNPAPEIRNPQSETHG